MINKKIYILYIFMSLLMLTSCSTEDPYVFSSHLPTYIGDNQNISTSTISMPNWMNDSVMYEVNFRQYSKEGTFRAFESNLPRLKELGVEILWFMPIHEISLVNRIGTLGSYYSIKDYYGVNPEFGTLEDYRHLVQSAKDMGFKIVMDIVFNHTGWDHDWISDHPEYYLHVNGEITHPIGTTWYDVAELDTSRSDTIQALGDVLYFWIHDFDIDGFRCDFASGVEKSTWETLRSRVASLKEDIFFLAEDNTRYDWFDTFNANYGGWDLLAHLQSIYQRNEQVVDLINYLKLANQRYPDGAFPLNFMTNHDMNSWEGTIESRFGESKSLMTMLTFTLPGMPLIYSGQESSSEHMLQFFEKDQINWNQYDDQPFFESLIDLKVNHEALYNDNFTNSTDFLYVNDPDILAFVRFDEASDDYVFVVANLSSYTITQTVEMNSYMDYWTDFSGNQVKLEEYQTFILEGYQYLIFTK